MQLTIKTSDRLTHYLCGRKPDHASGQHFIIPSEVSSGSSTHDHLQKHLHGQQPPVEHSEFTKAARKKLMALSNHLFEELAMDVYDEVRPA